jgi:hypothetical protein
VWITRLTPSSGRPARPFEEVVVSVPTSAPATTSRGLVLPRGPVLAALAYGICVLGPVLVFVAIIAAGDPDPYAPDGSVASIEAIGGFGTTALVLALAIALGLRRPERAGVAAVVLAVLSVVSLVFFWCGAPAVFGACAAWRAGLTRGGDPLGGAARVAGIVGAFALALNVVVTIGGFVLTAVTG